MPTNVYGENNMVTGKTILPPNFFQVDLCPPQATRLQRRLFMQSFIAKNSSQKSFITIDLDIYGNGRIH